MNKFSLKSFIKNLLKSKLRYSDNIGIIEMPLWRSFQIDSQNDLELIEKITQHIIK